MTHTEATALVATIRAQYLMNDDQTALVVQGGTRECCVGGAVWATLLGPGQPTPAFPTALELAGAYRQLQPLLDISAALSYARRTIRLHDHGHIDEAWAVVVAMLTDDRT